MKKFKIILKKRQNLRKSENNRVSYYLLHDSGLLEKKNYFKKVLFKINPKNTCILTNKVCFIFKEFRLSRFKFVEICNRGILSGLKKSAW